MSDQLLVEGTWPDRLRITSGWARAEARPWNDESSAAQLRLIRGGADFLGEATRLVGDCGGDPVYSPALYPTATRVWKRAGFLQVDHLLVLERSLSVPWTEPSIPIRIGEPDWDDLLAVDRTAFEGFWRMSRLGLEESAGTTRHSAVITTGEPDRMRGYAIVGAQRGVGYLQRIAVDPASSGRGLGTDLVRAAMTWAHRHGGRSMILNVREQAMPARNLYQATGFNDTGTRLAIMGLGVPPQPY